MHEPLLDGGDILQGVPEDVSEDPVDELDVPDVVGIRRCQGHVLEDALEPLPALVQGPLPAASP